MSDKNYCVFLFVYPFSLFFLMYLKFRKSLKKGADINAIKVYLFSFSTQKERERERKWKAIQS